MKASKCKFLYAIIFGVVLAASSPSLAKTITIFPSGDTTGGLDHFNIQNAMDSAAAGSTVKLAAGNFYVNQGIVVVGFNGTLRGTLSDHDEEVLTTLEAVAPFEYLHATDYNRDNPRTLYDDRIMPSVIFFEFPERKIAVRDLIFVANAPAYVESRPMWGNTNPDLDTTALTHFIGDFGNDVDATYRNLTFIAGEGDYLGSNVAAAIDTRRGLRRPAGVSRIGDPSLHGIGNAVFKHIRASNVREYVIVPMWYKNGTIDVEDVVSDVGTAVTLWGMMEMTTKITDVESIDSRRSLEIRHIYGGTIKVRRLTSLGGFNPSVRIINAENVDIRDSWLSDANGFGVYWRAPIYIRSQCQNITLVDNTIVDMTDVPAAVWVRWWDDPLVKNTGVLFKGNYFDPDNFPGAPGTYAIILGSDDSRVVEPTLQPNQVLDEGVNNTIKVGGM